MLQAILLANGLTSIGWWGFDVSPQTYTASMYILGASGVRQNYGNLTGINVSLRSNATGEIWATTKIPVSGDLSDFDYTYFSTALVNNVSAPDVNNVFAVTFNAAEVNGSTFYFDLISLFPETFNNRPNGLRKDLAQAVFDLNPTFLRFPGGNNLEGNSISDRWIWNNTIGLVDLPNLCVSFAKWSKSIERSERPSRRLGYVLRHE